jgi:hypothetical protein
VVTTSIHSEDPKSATLSQPSEPGEHPGSRGCRQVRQALEGRGDAVELREGDHEDHRHAAEHDGGLQRVVVHDRDDPAVDDVEADDDGHDHEDLVVVVVQAR